MVSCGSSLMKKLLSIGVLLLGHQMQGVDLYGQQAAGAIQNVRGRVHAVETRTPGGPVDGLPGLAPAARGNQARLTGTSARGDTIILSAVIAADGTFEFRDVPRGEYRVSIHPAGVSPATVVVADAEPAELHFGNRPARVTGSVVVDGGGPQPVFQLEFSKAGAPPVSVGVGRSFGAELPAGTFNVLPGGLPEGFSIRSITADGSDLTRQPLTVRSGETTQLAVVLGAAAVSPWVRLTGRITSSPGRVPANTIRLFGPATSGVLTARVNADGSFEFPQVLPGKYEARVLPSPIHFAVSLTVGTTDSHGIAIAPPAMKDLVGEFVRVEPGEFMMGCSPGDAACEPHEFPVHRVGITRPFEMGKFEVTQAQWEAVMGSNPSQVKGRDRPVDGINTWADAQEFIARLNALGDGHRYRLPTEAEWEYAARAGSTAPYHGAVDAVAWFQSNGGGQSHPVGQKQPNAWGLHDMLGNVAELVEDWHSPTYYSESPSLDPQGPLTGSLKFVRGGAWGHIAIWVRVSHRRSLPAGSYGGFGLRLVREAEK
jgi:formylglycine-generating enzyme required for sulfatase activity